MAKVGRPRKAGRPRKMKGGKGCHKIVIYRKTKSGRVTKVKGFTKKSCLKRKSKKK